MMVRLMRAERVAERLVILCALLASLVLTLNYRDEVVHLRHTLALSCAQREVQHDATHKAVGVSVTYYRVELRLLNANYKNQLKIIRSYPKSAQLKAIERMDANRRALQAVLAQDEDAYRIGATFNCAH